MATDAPEIEACRIAIVEATKQLQKLMLGPVDYLMSFSVSAS